MGSLATSLITILQRLRQSSGSLTLGNQFCTRVGCPPANSYTKMLEGFLINKHICSHSHLGVDSSSSSSSCTCIPKPSLITLVVTLVALVSLGLFLFDFLLNSQCFFSFQCVSVCARGPACVRAKEATLSVFCTQAYNSRSHDLICHCSFQRFASAFSVPCNIICCDC